MSKSPTENAKYLETEYLHRDRGKSGKHDEKISRKAKMLNTSKSSSNLPILSIDMEKEISVSHLRF